MRRIVWLGLLLGALACDPSVSLDCNLASRQALPAYQDSAECVGAVDTSDVVAVEECLTKTRKALELLERAETVCSGEVRTEIQAGIEMVREEIPMIEKTQAYNRGELDAAELLEGLLKDE